MLEFFLQQKEQTAQVLLAVEPLESVMLRANPNSHACEAFARCVPQQQVPDLLRILRLGLLS